MQQLLYLLFLHYFFSFTPALTLFVLVAVYIEFLLWAMTVMEEMEAASIKSG